MLLAAKIEEAAGYLRRQGIGSFAKGLALDPEMKGFAGELSGLTVVPVKDIPFFPPALSPLRRRKVLHGTLDDEAVTVLEGRGGLYEGYFHREIAFPLRVFAVLGLRRLILATSVFSLTPELRAGDLAIVEDHIDLSSGSALRGFQPASELALTPAQGYYSAPLRETAAAVAGRMKIELKRGVAALVNGPVGPTAAECRMLKSFGADMVSMTLAAEVAAAFHLGIEAVAVGVVSGARTGGSDAEEPYRWGPAPLSFFKELLVAV